MVSNNTLGEFTDQSESHDGPELKLYTAGDDTGAWAYVVTEKQTNVNPDTDTDADSDSDLPERLRHQLTQDTQSWFVPPIDFVMKGL